MKTARTASKTTGDQLSRNSPIFMADQVISIKAISFEIQFSLGGGNCPLATRNRLSITY
jgi:hypothetical protein